MTKIIIVGIGGVGGYFGGLLAKEFYNNTDVEIDFVARGEHLKAIQNNGLKVIKGNTEFIAKPRIATNEPSTIGIADFIIVCTKSYDLEQTIEQLKPCINADTIILPLLNGVDSREKIKKILPDNLILDGCVYIVSRLKEPGVIENNGNIQKLFFGLDNFTNERLTLLETLFKQATIEATLSQNISTVIWEKFIFISPTASATSYYDNCIGEIYADNEKLDTVKKLIEEVKTLAVAKRIPISDEITDKTLHVFKKMPFETTSSMHSDFRNKKPVTELHSLTGYVAREAKALSIETPTFDKIYTELSKRK